MEHRNFLFVSQGALIGDIAWQVSKEGHSTRYFIGSESERDIADGFVPKTRDWKKDVDWADVIIFDDTLGFGAEAEALRAEGKKVVGGTGHTPGWRTWFVRLGNWIDNLPRQWSGTTFWTITNA